MRPRGRRQYDSRRVGWPLVWAACLGASVGSAVRADGRDPFVHADVVDAIGLWRLADEAGELGLGEALKPGAARERALAAIRAAAYSRAPEQLIVGLLPHAVGRDPVLAPEAAMALVQIGQRLTPADLAAREVLLSTLDEARKATQVALEEVRSPRPDIRVCLETLLAALSELRAQLGAS
jgi:hypothetical protein